MRLRKIAVQPCFCLVLGNLGWTLSHRGEDIINVRMRTTLIFSMLSGIQLICQQTVDDCFANGILTVHMEAGGRV